MCRERAGSLSPVPFYPTGSNLDPVRSSPIPSYPARFTRLNSILSRFGSSRTPGPRHLPERDAPGGRGFTLTP
ncbi:unnamed protein product [Coccothraustes coccothraustes]